MVDLTRAFVDANPFLRYRTNDIPEQADAVEDLLDQAEAGKLCLVTTPLVIAEIVWTLESYYELPKIEVQEKVLAILNTPGLEVHDAEMILQAIVWYVDKNVDFIEAASASWMKAEDLTLAYTFDTRHFGRFEHIDARRP